jgi:GNAT superfamily N-acetyltransferase
MPFEILPLMDEHLEDAAALFVERYAEMRTHVPYLPAHFEDADAILPLLSEVAGRSPGVVALRDTKLVGFLVGLVLANYRGKRAVWSPEWANAAVGENSQAVYVRMYTELSARWVANGCFMHLISILAHQRDLINRLQWLGFGLMAADAMRDLGPVEGDIAVVEIQRASLDDIEQAMRLGEALQRYMASAPIFLAFAENHGRAYYSELLSSTDNVFWLARHDGEAVSFLSLRPSNPGAADIVQDERIVNITGAFTAERLRGRGIGAALLQRALAWARAAGYESCAVDFEPENVTGAHFWLRHFQPVCLSLARHVDERIAWAHHARDVENVWS